MFYCRESIRSNISIYPELYKIIRLISCGIFHRFLIKEGIYACRVLYMDIRVQGSIPLTRMDENLTLREIEQKAAELACFLREPIEVL
ncbi:Photosystem I assembly protein Ycf4 [Capsicum annuum]|uniref:Photosystem I assembly protein Ycf4 n=1 Tax=Capsicum annuum TaxID=4072 RepID=A0A2G2Y701_CAPAN|nr:Photosystem I assembly protein Ycf4 [Capsicum annuum]PHT65514.1 Photosystem I assembly protein Ycf4 [Capsicum annuum]